MSRESPELLIARPEAFLNLTPVERPLLGFWRGNYYPAEQFPDGTARWRDGQLMHPNDVAVGLSLQPIARQAEDIPALLEVLR